MREKIEVDILTYYIENALSGFSAIVSAIVTGRVSDSPSVRYLDPQLGTGHPCTRTSSVLYFLIRYLDPKVQ